MVALYSKSNSLIVLFIVKLVNLLVEPRKGRSQKSRQPIQRSTGGFRFFLLKGV